MKSKRKEYYSKIAAPNILRGLEKIYTVDELEKYKGKLLLFVSYHCNAWTPFIVWFGVLDGVKKFDRLNGLTNSKVNVQDAIPLYRSYNFNNIFDSKRLRDYAIVEDASIYCPPSVLIPNKQLIIYYHLYKMWYQTACKNAESI